MYGPPEPCLEPFTPCWCETRPNHPECEGITPDLVIDDGVLAMLFVAVVLMFLFSRPE
jgi:hypothetical protein